jgi:hypothetical protein
MKLGKPLPRVFCIDEDTNEFGLHVVTFMPTTGWKAVGSSTVTPTIDSNGNCIVDLFVEQTEDNFSFVTPLVHTMHLNVDDWTVTNGLIRVKIKEQVNENTTNFIGGSSINIDDADDGSLGGDDDPDN